MPPMCESERCFHEKYFVDQTTFREKKMMASGKRKGASLPTVEEEDADEGNG